jgi:hypothetical protein
MTNAIKALLQMTSVSLQPVPSLLCRPKNFGRHCLSIQKKKIVIRTVLSS